VRGCVFSYGEGEFRLGGVSLEVAAGEVVGIVGPNGSGKSTLLRLMGGLRAPQEGEVAMDGRPLAALSRRELARMLAFLPQEPETSFRFSVREVVAMGRFPHVGAFGFLSAHDIRAVETALAETATGGLAGRSFFTLSGGEKQRVLVASILAQEPSVMLLDEPTAALDIHHQSDIFDLLWRLSRKGIGVVAVTHDLNAAGQFCDRLVLLSGGRVAGAGLPREVLDEALLSQVYEADVRVFAHPVTGGPLVVVPGKAAHDA
jgi:iron complex transport system ATP-binding protein